MTPTSGHFYTHDALYNVTSMVDEATDSAVERYAYSPYGEATVLDASFTAVSGNSSDFDNELLYTGRRIDPATGLQLNRNRFYHQQLGRWVSRDPIGYDGGDMNLYGYVGPKIITLLDPFGLIPRDEVQCMLDKNLENMNGIMNYSTDGEYITLYEAQGLIREWSIAAGGRSSSL